MAAKEPGEALKAGTDAGVGAHPGWDGRAAVRDYIRAEIDKLDSHGLAPTKKAQKAAKKRRTFLADQLKIASGEDPRRVKLDAGLVRAARRSAPANAASSGGERNEQAPGIDEAPAGGVGASGSDRPSYWSDCVRMDFGELLAFVDEALDDQALARSERTSGTRPASEEQFSDLVRLLRRKAEEVLAIPPGPPDPGPPPQARPFEPSAELVHARTERGRAQEAVREAEDTPGATKGYLKPFRRRRDLAVRKARSMEARERETHEARRTEAEMYHERVTQHYEASARWRDALARQHRKRRQERIKAAKAIADRIRRTFAPGGAAGRLPWRLLPPGEISLGMLRRHYERVGARDPSLRYDMGRLEKAYSLGPSGCYTGLDEFEGYVVFTFPRTEKALLECPVYGHAIYVLGRDWKRLSRLSKQELLDDATSGVTKIVHRGDWFARTKLALGLR